MSQSLVLVEQTIGTDHVRRIILGHGTLASSRLFIYLFMLCFVFYIGLLVWYMGVKWLLFTFSNFYMSYLCNKTWVVLANL